jgi:hypothetical protein
MVYARVHDQTVAEDYYAAMSQVEKRLDLLGIQEGASAPINENERTQLLELTTQLEQLELSFDTRLTLVAQMRQVLAYPKINQTAYSLPAPILVGAGFT